MPSDSRKASGCCCLLVGCGSSSESVFIARPAGCLSVVKNLNEAALPLSLSASGEFRLMKISRTIWSKILATDGKGR
jgi:hypothetical protein